MSQPKSPSMPPEVLDKLIDNPESDWRYNPANPDYDYDTYETLYILRGLKIKREREEAQKLLNKADDKDKAK